MHHWQYRPFHISEPASNAAIGNNVSTIPGDMTTPGTQTITPESMANITVGRWLNFNDGTNPAEDVQVLSATTTTFTAVFAQSHANGCTISSQRTVDLGEFTVNEPEVGLRSVQNCAVKQIVILPSLAAS